MMKVWLLLVVASLVVGCFPVRFDRELWRRNHSEGGEIAGADVSIDISGDVNHIGARDVGDKKVIVGVTSKADQGVELRRIIVRSDDRNLYDFEPETRIRMVKHELAEQWDGDYQTDAILKFDGRVSTVYVDAFVRINGGGIRKVTSRFERDSIKGIRKVNLTEM